MKAKLEEITSRSSTESVQRAAYYIKGTYVFLILITVLSIAAAISLMIWGSSLPKDDDATNQKWLNDSGYVFSAFSVVLVLFVLTSYIFLIMRVKEIFGKDLTPEFKIL